MLLFSQVPGRVEAPRLCIPVPRLVSELPNLLGFALTCGLTLSSIPVQPSACLLRECLLPGSLSHGGGGSKPGTGTYLLLAILGALDIINTLWLGYAGATVIGNHVGMFGMVGVS